MVQYKISMKELDDLKADIEGGEKLDDYGNYKCGCALNPRYGLINKLCKKHQGSIKEE